MYMHTFGDPGHVITVSNHGSTDWDCKETKQDPVYAEKLIDKAKRVIFDDTPPPSADLFECQWCEMEGLCKRSELPVRNCRTCNTFEPYDNTSTWWCETNQLCYAAEDMEACQKHTFNPNIVPGELTADGTYLLRDGSTYADLHL